MPWHGAVCSVDAGPNPWPLPYIQDEGCLSLGPSQGFKDAIHITRGTPMMHLLGADISAFQT